MNIYNITSKILVLASSYFAPIQSIILAVLCLFMIDWITGVWKSYKCMRQFKSYRLRKSIDKLLAYMLAIIAAHILNESILSGVAHLPQIVAGYIGFTEITSIYENLAVITGKNFLLEILIQIKDAILKKKL